MAEFIFRTIIKSIFYMVVIGLLIPAIFAVIEISQVVIANQSLKVHDGFGVSCYKSQMDYGNTDYRVNKIDYRLRIDVPHKANIVHPSHYKSEQRCMQDIGKKYPVAFSDNMSPEVYTFSAYYLGRMMFALHILGIYLAIFLIFRHYKKKAEAQKIVNK